LKTIKPRI